MWTLQTARRFLTTQWLSAFQKRLASLEILLPLLLLLLFITVIQGVYTTICFEQMSEALLLLCAFMAQTGDWPSRVQGKVLPVYAMKSRSKASLSLNKGTIWEQLAAHPGKKAGTHWTGGFVGPRAGRDILKNKTSCSYRDSNSGLSNP